MVSSSSSSSEHESPVEPTGSLVPAGPRGIDKLTYARFPAALIASYSTAADVTSKLYPYKDLWFGIFKRGPHVQIFGVWAIYYRYWNACLVPYLDYWNACLPSVLFASLAYFDCLCQQPTTVLPVLLLYVDYIHGYRRGSSTTQIQMMPGDEILGL